MANAAGNTGTGTTIAKESIFSRKSFKDGIAGYLFIAPIVLGIILFSFYVFGSGLWLSFTDAEGINPGKFIGFANYKLLLTELFSGGTFWKSVRVTLIMEIGMAATQLPVAFVLAFILNGLPFKRLQGFLRAAFFLPVLVNVVMIGWLFRQIFNPDQGALNWFLGLFLGPTRVDLEQNQLLAPLLVIIASFWQWMGYHMVYFVSQLQTIDPSLYEAARIDGAGSVQIMTRITVPLMRPAFAFAFVTQAIGGLLIWDIIYVVFGAASIGVFGPGDSVLSLVPYIFKKAFMENFKLGLASAAGWLTFILVAIVSIFYLRIIGLGVSGEEE